MLVTFFFIFYFFYFIFCLKLSNRNAKENIHLTSNSLVVNKCDALLRKVPVVNESAWRSLEAVRRHAAATTSKSWLFVLFTDSTRSRRFTATGNTCSAHADFSQTWWKKKGAVSLEDCKHNKHSIIIQKKKLYKFKAKTTSHTCACKVLQATHLWMTLTKSTSERS